MNKASKFTKSIGFWLLLALIIAFFYQAQKTKVSPIETLYYSVFIEKVNKGEVQEVTIMENNIEGRLRDETRFRTYTPYQDPKLAETLQAKGVRIIGKPPTQWKTLLWNVLPFIVVFGLLWFFLFRRVEGAGKQAMSFGQSKAKLHTEPKTKITFKDVAGCDEAKEELKEVIEFLKDSKKFQRLGGKIPQGVLLMGPPGTGKTLLAKAVAGEAGVPFFSISGSDFVEMFVGVGASRVRSLFQQGKKNAPSIIFIDEIDAVGRQRFAGLGGGHDEREQTLNQLFVEMDGFDPNEGIILIAATNRPDVLDPALLRPGRFDRRIVVDRPDINGREAILKVHTRKIPLAKDADLKVIARRTPGFSGADLANVANEAALLAARKNRKQVTMEEVEESIDRVMAGPERKSMVISTEEKKIIAYHESGHALLALLIPEADPLHKVSILPRGLALGYTITPPIEDRYISTKKKLMAEIAKTLGGRASEEIVFNEVSTGAQSDLRVVTDEARRMVTRYGMSEKLGHLTFGRPHEQIFLGRDITEEKDYSEETARAIDREVRKIVDECYARAKELLKKNKKKLSLLAETLLEREVMDGEEVAQLVGIKKEFPKKKVSR
ncbi:ATP-dependent zinc metalloprotease FtsH [bacterium]|nr:ATP-dependent zinc metalloprotease FtsH [bacterium]MCG2678289.1 ATP-dependent zinc metalloprotease FtsH [bacterium]